MNLISVPKPAVGFHYAGTFQSIMDLQAFVTAQGYTVQAMSFNAGQDMLFDVNMSLLKALTPEDSLMYSSLTVRPDRIIVSPENTASVLVFTQEQLESEYTLAEQE